MDHLHHRREPVYIARAPSNIALLKYWGKRDEAAQWPANDSLSMTLSHAVTTTRAVAIQANDFCFSLNGQPLTRQSVAGGKIFAHLDRMTAITGNTQKLAISSDNSFPTGSGIASSASGFAALTLSVLAALNSATSLAELADKGFDAAAMARLARMGSGSACRSFHGGFVHWEAGDHPDRQRVSELFSADHWQLSDLIVILQTTPKTLSSTAGHRMASASPRFAQRLAALADRFAVMREAIRLRDLGRLGPLLEQEALEMHAVIESSLPGFRYLSPATHEFLDWLRNVRTRYGLQAFFTCDAGANVHVIGEPKTLEKLLKMLQEKDLQQKTILDVIGTGPILTVEDAALS